MNPIKPVVRPEKVASVPKEEKYAADVLDEMLDIYCDSRGLDRNRDLKVRSSRKLGICWVVQDLSRRSLI